MTPSSPTDCAHCREVVSARLDGEASAAERTAADAHLRGCPSCRHLAERMAVLDRWVRAAGEDTGDGLAPVVGSIVPASVCGCDAGCRCGCQDGRACRCARGAA